MPFTLAHPAAVLPLRRFCPRFLNFPALVVGSVGPDAGYAFGWLGADQVSHRFLGSFVFCLPVGLVLVGLFKCAVRSAECRMQRERDEQRRDEGTKNGGKGRTANVGDPGGAVHHLAGGWSGCLVVAGLSVGWGMAVVMSLRRVLAGGVAAKERKGHRESAEETAFSCGPGQGQQRE